MRVACSLCHTPSRWNRARLPGAIADTRNPMASPATAQRARRVRPRRFARARCGRHRAAKEPAWRRRCHHRRWQPPRSLIRSLHGTRRQSARHARCTLAKSQTHTAQCALGRGQQVKQQQTGVTGGGQQRMPAAEQPHQSVGEPHHDPCCVRLRNRPTNLARRCPGWTRRPASRPAMPRRAAPD